MRALFDNPALLLVGVVLPVLATVLGVLVLYWVVRLGVRHGAADADRAPGGGPTPPPAPEPRAED